MGDTKLKTVRFLINREIWLQHEKQGRDITEHKERCKDLIGGSGFLLGIFNELLGSRRVQVITNDNYKSKCKQSKNKADHRSESCSQRKKERVC